MTSASKKKTILFIVGPTAIGKTALAVKLAKAVRGEIISCDSMQVYKGMSILSQAPNAEERKKAKHHLVGILDPRREYSAAIFRKKAAVLIGSIVRHKKIPIVVGGTGLYVKALVDGLFPSPKADIIFRGKMQRFVSRYGGVKLHDRLCKIDPCAAESIHPNDTRRIIRALEIYHSTGRTMTEMKASTEGLAGEYDIKIFGLTKPREAIYSNINSRVDKIFKEGALKEAGRLKRINLSKTAKAVLGIKEISGYLNGEYGLDTARELTKRNTRRFAKRQLTWFRADKRIKWFDPGKVGEKEIIKNIVKEIR